MGARLVDRGIDPCGRAGVAVCKGGQLLLTMACKVLHRGKRHILCTTAGTGEESPGKQGKGEENDAGGDDCYYDDGRGREPARGVGIPPDKGGDIGHSPWQ